MENNIEEAKKWFRNLFKGCYIKTLDKYPNSIFWIYDKNLVRLKKLSKITGIEKYNLDMSDGELICEQDEKNRCFYIKYHNYWQFLRSNFNLNNNGTRELTTEVINDILNCKEYKMWCGYIRYSSEINDILNCKEYTTKNWQFGQKKKMNDLLNCKKYTTGNGGGFGAVLMNDILLKCKEYTI